MTELSALGIKVTSDGVVKTTGELERFAKASNAARAAAKPINVKVGVAGLSKAAADIQKMDKAMASLGGSAASKAAASTKAASASIASAGSAARQANAHVLAYRNAMALAEQAAWEKSMAAKAAANADQVAANRAWNASKAEEALANSSRKASIALKERAAAGRAAAVAATPRSGGGWGNQGNPANIAAQFQDIGVTAAMGMNPLMIALQQGTQLSAAMAGGIGNLAAAFKQVLSPASLLTIGLVALAAAGLQNIDWMNVAQSSLNMLASGMDAMASSAETLVPVIITAGTAMLIAFGPQLIAAVSAAAVAIGTTLVSAIVSATTAMVAFALANPFTAIVLGVTAAGAAIAYFAGATIDDLKGAIDFIIGGFVGAFNTIKRTWSMLPAAIGDATVQAVNWALRAITDLINKSISGINSLIGMIPEFMRPGKIGQFGGLGQMNNPWAGALAKTGNIVAEEMGKAQGVKYTDGFIASVKGALSSGAKAIRGFAAGLGSDATGASGTGRGAAGAAEKDPWAQLLDNADKQMRALQQAGAQIGVYGQALSRLRYEQELFNQAQDAGIKMTADQRLELSTRAAAMAAQEYQNVVNQARADSIKSHDEAIRQLDAERVALGLSGEALIAYEYQQSLINKQLSAGVALKDIDIAKTAEQARQYAALAIANEGLIQSQRAHQRAMQDAQYVTQRFFTDWIDGVREGENIFKSFANSVIDSLNRIIDKMMDNAWEAAFANMNGGNSGGGGFLGGLVDGIAALFGGGSKPVSNNAVAGLRAAKGAAFANDNEVMRFAKGGAFTNSIVSQPTLFKYANGGAFGEMGEAGPEAIMPLKRGPDGSLGVEAHGGGSRKVDVNIQNDYHIGGVMTPEAIIAAIRQGGEETMRAVQRQLPTIMNEYDRNGAVAA